MFRADRRVLPLLPFCALAGIPALLPSLAMAAIHDTPLIAGIPFEFIQFAATLAGMALLHRHTLPIAVVIPSWMPPPKHHAQAATRVFANTIIAAPA